MFQLLFVDDEINVLNGIKRSMRSMKGIWECSFAEGGEEAINMLKSRDFDAVISDINMPSINGIDILVFAKKHQPKIIRLALSGHAETEMELECAKAAHQFLAKPLAVEQLKQAIDTATNLKNLIDENEQISSLIGGIDSLPSLPEKYQRILQEAADKDGSITKIGKIISEDVSMTAKILQLVNSSFFGLHISIESVEHATNLLGLDIVKSLVFSEEIFKAYEKTVIKENDLQALSNHCNRTASLAKKIAMAIKLDKKQIDQSFMAGSIHELGKLVFFQSFPHEYADIYEATKAEQQALLNAESEKWQVTHDKVGAYLLGIWGLSSSIVEAIAYQYAPADSMNPNKSVLSAVYLANAIVNANECEHDTEKLIATLDTNYLHKLISEEKITAFKHEEISNYKT